MAGTKDDESNPFSEMNEKLDLLISLMAASVVKEMKQNEAILFLGNIRVDRQLIARVLGTTPHTVSVRLSEAKAKRSLTAKK